MKKITILLLFVLVSIWGFAQDPSPIPSIMVKKLIAPNNPTFYYDQADSSVWIYKGLYGWTKLADSARLQKDYVPYENAWRHVNLDTMSIRAGYVDLVAKNNPIHNPYRLFSDTTNHTLAFYNDEEHVTMQIGQEMWSRIYNNGSIALNGKVVRINGSFGKVATIGLASNVIHTSAEGVLGVATHDIETNTYGFITTFGEVHDLNTSMCSEGALLYLGTNGAFTHIRPVSPNFVIEIGTCIYSHATEGKILVNIKGSPHDIIQNAFNGSFMEGMKFSVASDGTTITGSLQLTGGGDLTAIFSDGFTTIDCTPAKTITLTQGSATVPQTNWVYLLKSTKDIAVSTSGWPTDEHIKISEVACRTAAQTLADGALRNQNWNDHLSGTNGMGHLQHVNERVRRMPSDWFSGTELTVNLVSASTPDNIYFNVTGGKVYQMHLQDFPAQSMPTADIHVVNHFTTPFITVNNINTQLTDALSVTLVNRSFSFVVWGVQNESGENSHLMLNLPIGSYTSSPLAIADASNYSVYTIPSQFRGVGFLIARITMSHSSAGSGTWTINQVQDLRGFLPNNTAGSGAAGSGTGVTTYLALLDTPNTYASSANKIQGVNAGETAIESKAATVTDLGTINIPTGQQYQINGGSIVVDAINDGVTTTASSQNAVFDALALKEPANANIQTHITNDADLSITNEIQDLSLSGNTLSLSSDATTVDVSQATAVLANTAKVTNATHSGDATGATALTLATVNSNIGTYNNITINAKGLATAGSNVDYAPASGSGNYIWNGTTQQPASNFNISGNGTVSGTINNLNIKLINSVYCIGNSLTASGNYPSQIQSLLGSNWNVINKGISGQEASEMAYRFKTEIIDNNDAKYVVILAGINDVNQDVSAIDIETYLQSMYTMAHNAGIKVVAVTLLPFKTHPVWTSGRQTVLDAVNTWILNTAINVDYTINAYPILEDPSNPDALLPAYSSDGLHLSSLGYQVLGTTIHSGVTWTYDSSAINLYVSGNSSINQNLRTFDTPKFQGLNISPAYDKYHPLLDGISFLDSIGTAEWKLYHNVYNPNGVKLDFFSLFNRTLNDDVVLWSPDGTQSNKGSIIPRTDALYDLGSDGIRWRDIHASRDITSERYMLNYGSIYAYGNLYIPTGAFSGHILTSDINGKGIWQPNYSDPSVVNTNYIPKKLSSGYWGNSLLYDSGNMINLGYNSPQARFHVYGSEDNTTLGGTTTSTIEITNDFTSGVGRYAELIFSTAQGGGGKRLAAISSAYTGFNANGNYAGNLVFSTRTSGSANLTNRLEINDLGGITISNLAGTGTRLVTATSSGVLGSTPTSSFASASGTTNYISKFTGTSTLGNSLIYDNGTKVAIGSTNPIGSLLTVMGDITINSGQGFYTNSYYSGGFKYLSNGYAANIVMEGNGDLRFDMAASGLAGNSASFATRFRFTNAGNLVLPILSSTNARLLSSSSAGQLTPITDGTSGQVLTTNGSGVYSFTTASGSATNLSYSTTTSTVTVISDTGTDAILPAATQSNAGVLNTVDKTKIDNIWNTSVQSLSGTTVTMTWTSGINATITLTGTTTLTIEGMPDGGESQIEVTNGSSAYSFNLDGSTGYTTEVVMGNNATINTTISSHTTVVIWRRGSTLYYGFIYNN